MAQVTETVARGILAGHGYTDNEVRQLAHHWLASHEQAPAQAAPAAVAVPSKAVAYLDIGSGGYLDLGSDLDDEELLKLPSGRHMLAIVGTFGVDGYTPAAAPATQAAPQPAVQQVDPIGYLAAYRRSKTMTDTDHKRMLEMAAKAAGMNDMKWAGGTLGMVKMLDPSRPNETGSIGPSWHPIINQGDAMELAARLAIDISHNHPADQQRYVAAERRGCECAFAPVCCIEDEFEEPQRLTAMCLAVTRAAAAIGEQMP